MYTSTLRVRPSNNRGVQFVLKHLVRYPETAVVPMDKFEHGSMAHSANTALRVAVVGSAVSFQASDCSVSVKVAPAPLNNLSSCKSVVHVVDGILDCEGALCYIV